MCNGKYDAADNQNLPRGDVSELDDLLSAALDLYKSPFKYHCTYIHDANSQMIMNVDERQETELILRGWGRIGYMKNAEKLHDAVGEHIATALTDYWVKNGR